MKERIVNQIIQGMLSVLSNAQAAHLQKVLAVAFSEVEVIAADCSEIKEDSISNKKIEELFIAAKKVEGCSEKSLKYYASTIRTMLDQIGKQVLEITTDDLRAYLTDYQVEKKSSKVTIDNIRRILSSFFTWLEDEDYILKSPIRRVGEMVRLNRDDIRFDERECVVFGKGDKERIVYFDARTKIHLQNYLQSRTDSDPALFVSLQSPHRRLTIGGIELRLRELGKRLDIPKVHPHKFRRTLATMAIDKGMPIEQLQHLLGHQRIDTTMQYAMVKQSNVKLAHKKYIG